MEKATLRKKVKDLSVLLEISKALVLEKYLSSLLNLIMKEVTRVMGAERSSLFLVEEEKKELYTYIAQGPEIKRIRLPLNEGIAGYVATTGKVLNIKDAYKDSRFDRAVDKKTGYRTKTILCVPMNNHKGEMIGVIEVLNKKRGYFTQYDESLLTALASQAAVAIENAKLYEDQEKLFKSLISTLAAAIDARDPVTAGHSERVTKYCLNIGEALKLGRTQLKILEYAAGLHDVGKIGIRDNVLSKPGKLTPEEYEIIKKHPVYTREILDKIYFSREQVDIPADAAAHHEKLDGSGYPRGLKDGEISQLARIIAVADVFDALVSYDRPYKPALLVKKALEILQAGTGRQFDAEIVDLFIKKKLYE